MQKNLRLFVPLSGGGMEIDMKRVFLTVLDSVGAGEMPDAASFGDVGAHTLQTLNESGECDIPNLKALGIGNIDGLDFFGRTDKQTAAVARLAEKSAGKDTTVGHWEIAGIVSEKPLPTYPNGFPSDIINEFSRRVSRGVLCNKPYSGTNVIRDYGEEHVKTGKLIVYTSADSVFQIAAHEDVVPLNELYDICKTARELLKGENGVGRVIARPFTGTAPNFTRTANRRDFSLEPFGETMLDAISKAGLDSVSIGKISDIFAGRGITRSIPSHGNAEGMDALYKMTGTDFHGICFCNLVDFDMLYGHRRDISGYARAMSEFDRRLPEFLGNMERDDVFMITADHGCDPAFTKTTDHTREYTPLIIYGDRIKSVNLGTRQGFCDIAATVTELLGVEYKTVGKSFACDILK